MNEEKLIELTLHDELLCALLSSGSYNNEFPYGFKLVWGGTIDNDSFSILMYGNTVFVVVRGSDDWKDWLLNFWAVKKNIGGGCRVSRGFHNSLKQIKPTIDRVLNEIVFDRVIFTGHSRAGATAQLCAWFFSQKFKTECYSFASPRIGNKKFAKELDKKVKVNMRYAIKSDIVTRMPKINYFHGGTLVTLPKQKGIANSHSIITYLKLMS